MSKINLITLSWKSPFIDTIVYFRNGLDFDIIKPSKLGYIEKSCGIVFADWICVAFSFIGKNVLLI